MGNRSHSLAGGREAARRRASKRLALASFPALKVVQFEKRDGLSQKAAVTDPIRIVLTSQLPA